MNSRTKENYRYSPIDKFLSQEEINAKTDIVIEDLNIFDGVVVGSLSSFAKQYEDIFAKYYDKAKDDDILANINTIQEPKGVVIYVPIGRTIEDVITIDLTAIKGVGYRNLIIIDSGAEAVIRVKHDTDSGVFGRLCEIFLEESATLEIIEDSISINEQKCLNSMYVKQYAHSLFKHTTIISVGGFRRNNIKVSMFEPHAECHLYGLTVLKGKAHVDNFTTIEHLAEDCVSHEHYKNVVDGEAKAIFSGCINVAQDAQKTAAYQKNNNILLSDTASVHSKPQLVIYADDVKCSHGATVGQLDKEALFYMRQRGISPESASKLLLSGFILDITSKIGIEILREELNQEIIEFL